LPHCKTTDRAEQYTPEWGACSKFKYSPTYADRGNNNAPPDGQEKRGLEIK